MDDNIRGERLVIIVENNDRTIAFIHSGLARAAYRVVGLQMFKMKRSNLMVLDMIMPAVGGFDFLKCLCQLSRIPLMIAGTGGAGEETAVSVEPGHSIIDITNMGTIMNRVKGLKVTRRNIHRETAIRYLQTSLSPAGYTLPAQ